MTFHGTCRASKKVQSHIHESPKVMTIPLLLLAIGAMFAGMYGYKSLGIVDGNLTFWNGSIVVLNDEIVLEGDKDKSIKTGNILEAAHHAPLWAKKAPLAVGLLGLFLAWLCYIKFPSLPKKISNAFPSYYAFLYNKWYFDELYNFLFVRPVKWLGHVLWQQGDIGIIDRYGPNGIAAACQQLAARISALQTGYVYHYAFVMLLGMIGIISYYVL